MRICTLVGADDSTPVASLWDLAVRFPFVEWGIHYNVDEEGCGRYPSFEWIRNLTHRIEHAGLSSRPRFALHISGEALEDFIRDRGEVITVARHFDRIQLNHVHQQFPLWEFTKIFERWKHKTIITRHNRENAHLSLLFCYLHSHAFIYDTSFGLGIERGDWPAPLYGARIYGYTGGLGPDNIVDQLPRIYSAAADRPFWIAAEHKMRNDLNQFDLGYAERILTGAESIAVRYGHAPFSSASGTG